jgi:hypothetical protein
MTTLTVPARFRGPPSSGNGGWTSGALAEASGFDPVTVRLLAPPPLDTPLDLVPVDGSVELRSGDRAVAVALPRGPEAWTDWTDVAPVSLEEARAAESAYPGRTAHPFPTCFACGPARAAGDGLCIYPGRTGDGLVAASWTPDPSVSEPDGTVGAPVTWAALDCVGGWSSDLEHRPMVLAQMSARVEQPPVAGTAYVVRGRLLRTEGRKTWTATALLDPADPGHAPAPGNGPGGTVLGQAEQLWIEVDWATVHHLQEP